MESQDIKKSKPFFLHFSIGLSSSLWDLSSRIDEQCQPPSSQPVSHHLNSCHFGHHFLDCGSSCVHLPAGLAQCGLQHCGWSHFHMHTGYQLHAVYTPGKNKMTQDLLTNVQYSVAKSGNHRVYHGDIEAHIIALKQKLWKEGAYHIIIGCYVWKPLFITDTDSVSQKL